MIVRHFLHTPPDGYDEFIKERGPIFQSAPWGKAYGETYGVVPEYLVLAGEQGNIRGSILFFKNKIAGLPFLKFFLRGGPVFRSEEDCALVLAALFNKAREGNVKSISIDSAYQSPTLRPIFEQAGFRPIEKYYFTIDLQKSAESLYNDLNRLIRKNIRRAREKSIAVVEIETSDSGLLQEYYRLAKYTAERGSIKAQTVNAYQSIFENLSSGGNVKYYLAKLSDGTFISGCMILMWRGTAFYYGTGSDPRYFGYNAQDLLLWHAIESLRKKDFTAFNLMDVAGGPRSEKEEGIFRFKRHWAGKETPSLYYHYQWDSPSVRLLRGPRKAWSKVRVMLWH